MQQVDEDGDKLPASQFKDFTGLQITQVWDFTSLQVTQVWDCMGLQIRYGSKTVSEVKCQPYNWQYVFRKGPLV